VILLSPERLASDSFKLNVLQPISSTLGLLVIDEVHCISVWGHDFRPEYRRIGVALQLIPADTPVLGTTATANERVLEDVKAVMGSDVTIQRGSLLRSSLALYVVRMDDTASRLAWLATNLRNMPTSSGIIYTNTRHDADQVILRSLFSHFHPFIDLIYQAVFKYFGSCLQHTAIQHLRCLLPLMAPFLIASIK